MKDFILRNKYTIIFILTVLIDWIFSLQDMVGITPFYQFLIRSAGFFFVALLNKVQVENKAAIIASGMPLKEYRFRRVNGMPMPKVVEQFTLLSMLWNLFTGFFTHVSNFSNFRTSNGPSHLLIGLGIMFTWCTLPLPQPEWQSYVILAVGGGITSFGFGLVIELCQQTFWGAQPSDQDILNTGCGFLFSVPIGMIMVHYHLNSIMLLCMAAASWVIAYAIHKDAP